MKLDRFARILRGATYASVALVVGACASDVSQVQTLQAMEVRDPTQVKPVAITKVVAKIRRGTEVGQLQGGAFCVAQSKINWNSGGAVNFSSEELVDVFRDELEVNGWPVVGSTDDLFSGYDVTGAELLIAARISDLSANVCMPMIGFGNFNKKGSMNMTVDWQVYNPARREIIGEIQTRGSYIQKAAVPAGDYELMANSFSVAINNLLANKEFQDVVKRSNELAKVPSTNAQLQIPNVYVNYPSPQEAIAQAKKATVIVRTAGGMGSAFAVGDGSLLLTNAHVVGDAENVTLVAAGGIEIPAQVKAKDKGRDVAILAISGLKLPALHLDRRNPEVATRVFAVGSPLDELLEGTVTAGIVSSVREFEGYNWIQSDVAVSPGNSGGPLINERGSVVAITAAGFQPAGSQVGLNLFVPIADALNFLGVEISATESGKIN